MAQANDRFKDYVTVPTRIHQFYEKYPDGRILTSILEHDRNEGFILIRSEVYRDAVCTLPAATGHAFELQDVGYVNKTSYIENAETSAVGRALGILGFGSKDSIASREEVESAVAAQESEPQVKSAPKKPAAAKSGAKKAETQHDLTADELAQMRTMYKVLTSDPYDVERDFLIERCLPENYGAFSDVDKAVYGEVMTAMATMKRTMDKAFESAK